MIKLGANVAIFRFDKVLLAKREDFEVWCLPGGMVEFGESVAQAAIREAREETGLEVELLRLVGVYSRLMGSADVHEVLFAARPTGGTLSPQTGEVLELRHFTPEALPNHILWWHRRQVADACKGRNDSVAWLQKAASEIGSYSRQELYDLRDRSGLSRLEFYKHLLEQHQLVEILEVGGIQAVAMVED